jgi:anti-anti-sigma regulatory factor
MKELQVHVQRVGERTAVINLVGDITTFIDTPIHEAYRSISAEGISNVILNFVDSSAICSPGIAALLDVVVAANEKNQKVMMALPNDYFKKVFDMMGLGQHVSIFNSLEEATSLVS